MPWQRVGARCGAAKWRTPWTAPICGHSPGPWRPPRRCARARRSRAASSAAGSELCAQPGALASPRRRPRLGRASAEVGPPGPSAAPCSAPGELVGAAWAGQPSRAGPAAAGPGNAPTGPSASASAAPWGTPPVGPGSPVHAFRSALAAAHHREDAPRPPGAPPRPGKAGAGSGARRFSNVVAVYSPKRD